jgi:ribosome-associated protein
VSYEIPNQHKDPAVQAIVNSLEDNKAENVIVIPLKGKAEFAEFMVVASGRSNKHVDSVSEKVYRDLKSQKYFVHKPEGKPLCDWTVIDAGHVLVHIFRNEVREVYDLEKLWSEDFTNINTAS